MSYDYHTLSPVDFERLCCGVLSQLYGVRFQRFAEGRDGGVDLMYEDSNGIKSIFQCKRYKDYASLLRVLKNTEVSKVRRLNPGHYGLLVSCSLTPKNKQEIVALFSPYLTTQNVLCKEELDDLLVKDDYLHIVSSMPTLWLPTFSLVQTILNNRIIGRSAFEAKGFVKDVAGLFWTSIAEVGFKKLENEHVVIFVGDPGVGKTISAEMLLCKYAQEGFEPVITYSNIEDFEDLYEEGKKQIFYFDDFLGSNYFDAIENHEDTKIVRFIKRVVADKDKRFILTSRTTILNRGIEFSLSFRNSHLNDHKYEINVNALTEEDKANILYYLMRKSNCTVEDIASVLKERRYRTIISHEKFNPRIVAYILGCEENACGEKDTSKSLYDRIIFALNNPAIMWASVYENQCDIADRVLLWLVFLQLKVEEPVLQAQHDRWILQSTGTAIHIGRHTFHNVVRSITGSLLLRIYDKNKAVHYSILNHSIEDCLISKWREDGLSVKFALCASGSDKAVRRFISIARFSDSVKLQEVLTYLANNSTIVDNVGMMLAIMAHSFLNIDPINVVKYVANIDITSLDDSQLEDLCNILIRLDDMSIDLSDVLQKLSQDEWDKLMDWGMDFEKAVRLYKLADKHCDELPAATERMLQDSLLAAVRDEAEQIDCNDLEYRPESGYLEPTSRACSNIAGRLIDFMVATIDEYGLPSDLVDVDKCMDDFDGWDIFNRNPDDEDCNYSAGVGLSADSIDIMFESYAKELSI